MKPTFSIPFTLLAILGLATAAVLPVEERSSNVADVDKRASCVLHTIWESNWGDGAYHRYRVHGWAEGSFGVTNSYEMIRQWCTYFKRMFRLSFHVDSPRARGNTNETSTQGSQKTRVAPTSPSFRILSPSEFTNEAWGDVSTFEGSNGHQIYVNHNQAVVNSWCEWSGYRCDVDSSF